MSLIIIYAFIYLQKSACFMVDSRNAHGVSGSTYLAHLLISIQQAEDMLNTQVLLARKRPLFAILSENNQRQGAHKSDE